MIPTLKNGCCGCTLQTSSLVIAWIQCIFSTLMLLMMSIFGTIMIAWVLNNPDFQEGQAKHNISPEDAKAAELAMQIALGLVIAIFIVRFLLDLGLLVGIYKRNYCLMMPYLILGGVGVVCLILMAVFSFFTIFSSISNFGQFISALIYAALSTYFWLILYSYYREIKTEAHVNQNTFNKI